MRDKFFFLAVLLALAVATLPAGTSTAGSLRGFVRDLGKNPPENGLSGAKVQLRPSIGNPTDPVITDTDGEYRVVHVAKGAFRLVVIMAGYIPRPHERIKIWVDGDSEAEDVLLMQEYGSETYYSGVATCIVRRVASAPADDRKKALAIEWDNLRAIDLPPYSKALLARELNKQDASAKEVLPDFKSYLAAKPEDIKKAQLRFGQALAGKADLPGQESLAEMKLSYEIVADLVQFQVKNSREPKEKTKAFVKEFLLKWNNTPASKRFLELQKVSLDESPWMKEKQ